MSPTQRYNPAISWHLTLPWEYMLREIILKSVTPSPLDANVPHKRPLDVSYYGGPVAAYDDKDDILSRGNVYRLLNGHWMLCQDECIDCEPCKVQRNPLFKWILQRIKKPPNSKLSRHDLQLTIMPQANDHFHTGNLWPNYYVYVTPQGERATTSTIRTRDDNEPENPLPGFEDSFSEHHRRSKDLLTERDRDEMSQEDNRATVQENVSPEKTEEEESIERKHGLENMRPRHRPRSRPEEKTAEEANQLAPRLILGTDQKGQKHLVHVVPADHPTTTTFPAISLLPDHPTSSQFAEGQATHSNNTIPERERQTYQRVFRRVFDSLNTHRRSIESFLESPDNIDDHRLSPSTDNIEVAGFSWNNRDINHKNANFDPLHFNDASLSSFYAGNEDKTGTQHRKRYGDEYMNQDNYYTAYQDMNQDKMSRGQSQKDFNLDLGRQRRRVRVKPYFINGKNILRINSSVPSSNLDSYSVNAIQKSDSIKGFVMNSAKQIDLNDTFVEKANNNSMESSPITTKQENGQLFGLERQRSSDVNREFEASHHAFRVIVTTEPVIRSEHETLNRTTVLQITTSKTFVNNS